MGGRVQKMVVVGGRGCNEQLVKNIIFYNTHIVMNALRTENTRLYKLKRRNNREPSVHRQCPLLDRRAVYCKAGHSANRVGLRMRQFNSACSPIRYTLDRVGFTMWV